MAYISIRDLQRMSSDKIAALDGPTAVKSGDMTIALLTPIRPAKGTRRGFSTWAKQRMAEEKARRTTMTQAERNAEDALLTEWGVDLTFYDEAEINRLKRGIVKPRKI